MEYLVEWAQMLHGRSGAHMGGAMPVSHREIKAWQEAMDIGELHPLEVEALVMIDLAMLQTTGKEPSKEKAVKLQEQQPSRVWPRRR